MGEVRTALFPYRNQNQRVVVEKIITNLRSAKPETVEDLAEALNLHPTIVKIVYKRLQRGKNPYRSMKLCIIEGCPNELRARGFCEMHLYRNRHQLDMLAAKEVLRFKPKIHQNCRVNGCDRAKIYKEYCSLHQNRLRKGLPLDVPLGQLRGSRYCRLCPRYRLYRDGLCRPHHKRALGIINPELPVKALERVRKCKVSDCLDHYFVGGYCRPHHGKARVFGEILIRSKAAI